jgi:transcription elongation factor GreA
MQNYLSQEKFDALTEELHRLKTVDRREVAVELEEAKALGDLSENAEYHEALAKQGGIEDRIAHLEEILKTASIIASHHSSVIEVGSTIVVEKKGGDKSQYMIVGSEEADIAAGKISHQSPLGSALLGKKAGDTTKVETPKGIVDYKVVEIK